VSDDTKMSFLQHLEELRQRLIKSVIAIFVGMIICWFFRESILGFLLTPLYDAWNQVEGLPDPKPLNFSSMLEPFIAYLKLSAIGGLFLGSPVILYQLWKFIAPGLYPKERRLAFPFVVVSSLLFVGGSLMAYSLVFPLGFRFFLEFAAGQEITTLTANVELAALVDDGASRKPDPFAAAEPESTSTAQDGGSPDAGDFSPAADAGAGPQPGGQGMGNGPAPLPARTQPDNGTSAKQGDDGDAWYRWLLGKFFRAECGVFEARRSENGDKGGTALAFRWHVAKCGEPPELSRVMRNDEAIALDWKPATSTTPAYRNFIAQDASLLPGNYTYSLRIPANPGFKRLAPVLMIKDYLSLAIRLLLAFGLVFELPILISFLSLAGIVNYKQLLQFSRWFLVISVVFGALLTPPDVITQVLLALPLMALYFLSILFAFFFGPKPDPD